jgi:peptide/nickel transport system ATP-binding protein
MLTVRNLRKHLPLRGLLGFVNAHVQMVFQDSYASLSPRHTAMKEIAFGLRVHGNALAHARDKARDRLRLVGLDPELDSDRCPHDMSGGQRQRVNIARRIALHRSAIWGWRRSS